MARHAPHRDLDKAAIQRQAKERRDMLARSTRVTKMVAVRGVLVEADVLRCPPAGFQGVEQTYRLIGQRARKGIGGGEHG